MLPRLILICAIAAISLGLFPSLTHAGWFGKEDPRYDPKAYISSPEEQKKYSGVGVIQCPSHETIMKDGKLEKLFLKATGFHIGSFQIMVTNSHAFYEKDPLTGYPKSAVNPRECKAIFYDYAGEFLEDVPVERIVSRWDDQKYMGDWTQDIAIIVLEKESTFPAYHVPFEISKSSMGPVRRNIHIVGYHLDVSDSKLKRIGFGTIFEPLPNNSRSVISQREGQAVSNNMVFIGDYPSGPGSSGSPIFSDTGRVIGIHQGEMKRSVDGVRSRDFDPTKNFNNGILFDQRFYDELKAVYDGLSSK